ncbi:Uncharacterized protein TCM_035832 [Theobroma cacao]|uniref:Uncharacterized protein n=1 Tax=Theobroma cacao TaxID=3641 RepID=A0A061FJ01_THECC|nr:Uncharacterized protein TCM_035832 [Theobroma cacao]
MDLSVGSRRSKAKQSSSHCRPLVYRGEDKGELACLKVKGSQGSKASYLLYLSSGGLKRSSLRPRGSFLPYSILFPHRNVLKKKRKIVPGEGESLESRLAKLGLHCKIFLDGK